MAMVVILGLVLTSLIILLASTGYKSISRDTEVPLSTVLNIIKNFTTQDTVAHLP